MRGSGLTTAHIKEPAEFILDASDLRKDAMGKCTATLHGDRADVPVKLSALGNQVFKVRKKLEIFKVKFILFKVL